METIVANLPKNTREAVRVELTEFKGFRLLGIRVWTTEGRPTAKGLTVKVEMLPELVKALQTAEALARSAGLL